MADNVGDIQLNISVNVKGAAAINALNKSLTTLAQRAAAVGKAQTAASTAIVRGAKQTTTAVQAAAMTQGAAQTRLTKAIANQAVVQQKAAAAIKAAQTRATAATVKQAQIVASATARRVNAEKTAAVQIAAAVGKVAAAHLASAQRVAAAEKRAAAVVAAATGKSAAAQATAAKRAAAIRIKAAETAAAAMKRAVASEATAVARASATQQRAADRAAAAIAKGAAAQQKAIAAVNTAVQRGAAAQERAAQRVASAQARLSAVTAAAAAKAAAQTQRATAAQTKASAAQVAAQQRASAATTKAAAQQAIATARVSAAQARATAVQKAAAAQAAVAAQKVIAAQNAVVAAQNKSAASQAAAAQRLQAAQARATAAQVRAAAQVAAAQQRLSAAQAKAAAAGVKSSQQQALAQQRLAAATQRAAAAQVRSAQQLATAQARASQQAAAAQQRLAAANARTAQQQTAAQQRMAQQAAAAQQKQIAQQQKMSAVSTASANRQAAAHARIAAAVAREAAEMKTLYGRLTRAEEKYDAIFRASYRLQNVGYGLLSVSKKMFDELRNLTDAWGKFEFMVHRAAGALQIWKEVGGEINPVYEALIENVYRVTKELGLFPAEDVAKATYYWGSTTGQQVKNLNDLRIVMSAITPIMKVAALTEVSYETAIKGVYSILIQYHRGLSDAADITHKLFLVTQRTALEFPDLINAFKFVGPVAGALGVSFEEVAETLGAVGDAGIRGTMAGRALRQMFIQTVRPTVKARTMLDNLFRTTVELGKGFEEIVFPNGKFIGITSYVEKLAISLRNASTRQRQLLYASISTANELPLITALVENQIRVLKGSADAYDMTKTSVRDAATAAEAFERSWDLLSKSWRGVVGRLRAGAEIIKLKVGRAIAEALTEPIEQMTKFINKIEVWVDRNPELVKTIGRTATALGGLAAVAGGMLVLAGALLGLYAAVKVIGAGFGPILSLGLGALGVISAIAESIVSNWTMIVRTLLPAMRKLRATLTGGNLDAAKKEWEDLHSAIKSIIDFIVKTAVKGLRMFLDALNAILNSPARPFIDALGKALITAFGIRTLAQVLLIGRAILFLLSLFKASAFGTALGVFILKFGAFGRTVLAALVLIKNGFVAVTTAVRLLGVAGAIVYARFAVFRSVATMLIAIRGASLASAAAFFTMGITSGGAAAGVRALAGALMTLSKTSVLIIITAIVFALQTLYDMDFLGIKTQMEGVGESTEDLTEKMRNFYFEVGAGSKELEATINAAVAAAGGQAQRISEIQSALARLMANDDWKWDFDKYAKVGELQQELRGIEKAAAQAADAYRTEMQRIADDTGHMVGEVWDITRKMGPKIWGPLTEPGNFDKSLKFAERYFNQLGDKAVLSAKDAIKLWNDTVKSGALVGQDISPMEFINLTVPTEEIDKWKADYAAKLDLKEVYKQLQDDNYAMAANILVGLKAGADSYGPEINDEVKRLLDGMPQVATGIIEETQDIMLQAPGEILTALTDGFKAIGDIKKRFKEALKSKIKTSDLVDALFGDLTSTDVTGALTSTNASMVLWGKQVVAQAHTSFVAGAAAYESVGQAKTFAKEIRKSVKKDYGPDAFKQIYTGVFKGNWWKKLTPEQQAGLQEVVDWAALQLGLTKPTPGTIEEAAKGLTGKVREMFIAEFKKEYGDTPVAQGTEVNPLQDMLDQMLPVWNTTGKTLVQTVIADLGSIYTETKAKFQAGLNPMTEFNRGMASAINGPDGPIAQTNYVTKYMSDNLIGLSPPPSGPLANITTGGINLMFAYADGVTIGGAAVALAAVKIATQIATILSTPTAAGLATLGLMFTGVTLAATGLGTMLGFVAGMMNAAAVATAVATGATNLLTTAHTKVTGAINLTTRATMGLVGSFLLAMAFAHRFADSTDTVRAKLLLLIFRILTVVAVIKIMTNINLFKGGWNTIRSWVDGMMAYWRNIGHARLLAIAYQAKLITAGTSPPKKGPLHTIDKGGYNLMKAWSDGIALGGKEAVQSAKIASMAVRDALSREAMTPNQALSFDSSNEKLIKVQVDVKSADGSVSGVDMSTLSDALIPELVRSLERASVNA